MLYLLLVVGVYATIPTIISTTGGDIQGVHDPQGSTAFRGIPYAEAPVGHLRWAHPHPKTPWQVVRNATRDGAACPQTQCTMPSWACPKHTSEDCLFLNVFVPDGVEPGSDTPVMVFLHGGNFYQGEGGGYLYDGGYLAKTGTPIVLVTLNYRIGLLGFLFKEGKVAGNFGLQDQELALRWVQDNIARFGGDPGHVTLFGQSAGAMSVAIHLTSPQAAPGLFHQAILESEPLNLPMRTKKHWATVYDHLSLLTGCLLGSMKCLRNVDAKRLMRVEGTLIQDVLANTADLLELFVPFPPAVGTPYVPQQPFTALRHGQYTKMPILMGNTAQESTVFIYEAFTGKVPMWSLKTIASFIFGAKHTARIFKHYQSTGVDDARQLMGEPVTDSLFLCPNRNVMRALAEHEDADHHGLYYYVFDHAPSDSSAWEDQSECNTISCHGIELPWVFHSMSRFHTTEEERALSDTIIGYWSNFATYGNPNGVSVIGTGTAGGSLPYWPKYTKDTNHHMVLQTPEPVSGIDYRKEDCDWWEANVGYNF